MRFIAYVEKEGPQFGVDFDDQYQAAKKARAMSASSKDYAIVWDGFKKKPIFRVEPSGCDWWLDSKTSCSFPEDQRPPDLWPTPPELVMASTTLILIQKDGWHYVIDKKLGILVKTSDPKHAKRAFDVRIRPIALPSKSISGSVHSEF